MGPLNLALGVGLCMKSPPRRGDDETKTGNTSRSLADIEDSPQLLLFNIQ